MEDIQVQIQNHQKTIQLCTHQMRLPKNETSCRHLKRGLSSLKTILIRNHEKTQHIQTCCIYCQARIPRPQESQKHLRRGINYAWKNDRWHILCHVDSMLSNLSLKTRTLCFNLINETRENQIQSHNTFAFCCHRNHLKMFRSSTRATHQISANQNSWFNGS